MARVVVVGAGVGGLSAALRLQAFGHDVTVFEAGRAGGKLSSIEIEGHTFDTGPSLLTLPHVFEELFAVAGASLTEHLELHRLQQPFRHHFRDGSVLQTWDEPSLTRSAFDEFADGAGQQWQQAFSHSQRVWEISERTFFSGEMGSPASMLSRMRSPLDLWHIDGMSTLAARSRRLFDDPRLQAWMNRFATYSGSSPYAAPATLSCIAYIEQRYGAWHVRGGLGRLGQELVGLAATVGVDVSEHTPVERVITRANRVRGVQLADGTEVDADAVVSDVNAERLFNTLLPDEKGRRRARSAGRSSSVLAICLGLRGQQAGPSHHNLWYSADQRKEFHQIFDGPGIADDPTVYACVPTAVDSSLAPEGDESWFLLLNVAAGARTDWDAYADEVIDRLALTSRVKFRHLVTPQTIEASFGDPGGAIYGTSSNGRRAAFVRARNRGPIKGLYLCGGSAHPGGGLPLVATSGKIAAEIVERDVTH